MARDTFHDDGYDSDIIYSDGAKDHQGHSTNIRCHIPDHWVSIIAAIVNSDQWPEYRTPQDFYRDAIFHRWHWAARQGNRRLDPRVRTLMAIANGEAALNHANTVRTSSQLFVENARATLSSLVADGNHQAVRLTIKELEASLDDLEEPWRGQLENELSTWERRISLA